MGAWRGYVVVGCAAAALAAAATAFVSSGHLTRPASSSDEPLVAVAEQMFTDSRPIQLTLVAGASHEVLSNVSGTVTRATCSVGGAITTGDVLFDVDQQAVVSVVADAPLFRDLTGGEAGADVGALQAELRQLGYSAGQSGSFDRATKNAVRAFLSDRGVVRTGAVRGVLRLSDVMWAPRGSRIAMCPVGVGAHVGAGEALVFVEGQGARVDVPVGETALTGDRVVVVGSERVALVEGALTDPIAVAAVFATPEAQASLRRGETTVGAMIELAEPTRVIAVPPSALVGISGSRACVFDGESVREVSIVSSRLGRAFVLVEGSLLSHVDPFPSAELACG